jgi:tetratricopeptide (TPR) repeat protein/predicted Ser/Thr protein kinase
MPDHLPPSEPPPLSEDTEASRLPQSVPEHIGTYKILGILGKGGMGIVYRAEQEQPHRVIAVKVVQPGKATAKRLARFELEAEVLGRLHHPGIAQIYEAGVDDGGQGPQPFFAMELVEGQPLTAYAQAHLPGVRSRVELMVQVCDAVQHAHQKGIIHRDLKPANILVESSGQPKVLDFGVARVTDADVRATTAHTDVGELIGTLPYMSPEQIAADPQELDTRSDVYALGVVLYELLTGRLPQDLRGKPPLQIMRTISEEPHTPASSVDRTFRGDIDTVIAKALEKDKNQRYSSVSDLAEDLRRYLKDEPLLARPTGALYHLGKFTRRNKVLVGGVAAVLLTLCLGLLGTGLSLWRARRAESRVVEKNLQQAKQRGAWRSYLALCDDALARGYPDSPGLRLDRVRAFAAVNDYTNVNNELQRIEELAKKHPLTDQEEARRLLWQGDTRLLRSPNPQEPLKLIQQALDRGLPEADDAYARGLLATHSETALRHFYRAVELDPVHLRARGQIALLTLSLGRFDETRRQLDVAESLSPEDANLKTLRAMLRALEGNKEGAYQTLEQARSQLGDQQIAALRIVIDLLFELTLWEEYARMPNPETRFQHVLQKFQTLPLLGQIDIRLHPIITNLFPRFDPTSMAIVFPGQLGLPQLIEHLEQIARNHPEGTLHYIRAFLLLQAEGDNRRAAEEAFRAAANTTSVARIEPAALFHSIWMEWTLSNRNLAEIPNPVIRQRVVDHIRRLVRLYTDKTGLNMPPEYANHIAAIAAKTGQHDLARYIIREWQRIDPTNPSCRRWRAFVEYVSGSYVQAIAAAREGLALSDPVLYTRLTTQLGTPSGQGPLLAVTALLPRKSSQDRFVLQNLTFMLQDAPRKLRKQAEDFQPPKEARSTKETKKLP